MSKTSKKRNSKENFMDFKSANRSKFRRGRSYGIAHRGRNSGNRSSSQSFAHKRDTMVHDLKSNEFRYSNVSSDNSTKSRYMMTGDETVVSGGGDSYELNHSAIFDFDIHALAEGILSLDLTSRLYLDSKYTYNNPVNIDKTQISDINSSAVNNEDDVVVPDKKNVHRQQILHSDRIPSLNVKDVGSNYIGEVLNNPLPRMHSKNSKQQQKKSREKIKKKLPSKTMISKNEAPSLGITTPSTDTELDDLLTILDTTTSSSSDLVSISNTIHQYTNASNPNNNDSRQKELNATMTKMIETNEFDGDLEILNKNNLLHSSSEASAMDAELDALLDL